MTVNRSAPWARLVPVLAVADVPRAVSWYVAVFGLVEHVRVGEGHRVQLGFDGVRAELIVREFPENRPAPNTSGEVMIRVDDVDAVLDAARSRGADADDAAQTFPYGERQARFVDPFDHTWVVTQTVDDVDPSAWGGETVVPRH